MKSHRLTVRGSLISINAERRCHPIRRAELVRQWRTDAAWEARAAQIPHLHRVTIIATPYQHNARLGDAGNHPPSVKAIIDALCDVGVLDGDGPQHVASLTLMAPRRTKHTDRVEIELIEMAVEAVV
jgi:hypothetical protein